MAVWEWSVRRCFNQIILAPCVVQPKYDPVYSEQRQVVSTVHGGDEGEEHVEGETGQKHPSHLEQKNVIIEF